MGRTLAYRSAQFNCTHDARWSGLEADVIIKVLSAQLISKCHLKTTHIVHFDRRQNLISQSLKEPSL